MLTTYDTDRDIRAAMDAGANGYLLKDVPRAELVRAVHDLADGRPVLTASALEVLAGRREQTSLTARELEVLNVIASGGTNRSAAERLLVSEATVTTHLLHVYEKLGGGRPGRRRAGGLRAPSPLTGPGPRPAPDPPLGQGIIHDNRGVDCR